MDGEQVHGREQQQGQQNEYDRQQNIDFDDVKQMNGDRRVKRTHFGAENGPTW